MLTTRLGAWLAVRCRKLNRVRRHARGLEIGCHLEMLEERQCPAIGLWQGSFGSGDLRGSGGGLQITSSSGTVSAVIDTLGAARSFTLAGTGTGLINISGVNCPGSGFGLSSSGTVQNLSINSDFSGSGQGTCPPPISGGGNVNYSGTLSGTLNAALTAASGTWTANWNGNFGKSGTMNGTWTSDGQLANDLVATALTWQNRTSDVQFSFQVSGANIPVVSSYAITLHWASGTTPDTIIGSASSLTATNTEVGSFEKSVPATDLSAIPANATHLLAVLDAFDTVLESSEQNNVFAVVLPPAADDNHAPDAFDDYIPVAEDAPTTPIDVLANDTADPDQGETLVVTAVTQPQHGVAGVSAGGTGVSYTPQLNFFGDDSFDYTISDGRGGSDTALVQVSVTPVNDPPNAVDDSTSVLTDSAESVINVLVNDRFIPDAGETLTVTEVTQPTNGVSAVTSGGANVSYKPNAGFMGSDTFNYTISDGNGGTDSATVTVSVGSSGTIQFGASDFRVAESAGSVTITVTRTSGASGRVSVNYRTQQVNGTNGARFGQDLTLKSGSITFEDGDNTEKTFSIPIRSDTTAEPDETFQIALTSPTGGAMLGSPDLATVTITEPGTLKFGQAAYTVVENDGSISITVERISGSGGTVSATVQTISGRPGSGQATSNVDYTPIYQTIMFSDGDTEPKTVAIRIKADTTDESDETFSVSLSSPTGGAVLGNPKSSTVTITNETLLSLSETSYIVNENDGSVVIPVKRTGSSSGSVIVTYATSVSCPPIAPVRGPGRRPGLPEFDQAESAKTDTDFTAASGTISFENGDTETKIIRISIVDDTRVEDDELFCVILSNPTGRAKLGSERRANVTIKDFEFGRIEGIAFYEYLVDGKYYRPAQFSPNDDSVEVPLQLGNVFLDDNRNKYLDPWERTKTPDSNGRYAFDFVAPGVHSVCLKPSDSTFETVCNVVTLQSGRTAKKVLLGTYRTAVIHGHVTFEFGEQLINQSGVTFFLDLDDDRMLTVDEPTEISNGNGVFEFRGLTPGTDYTVRQIVPVGFVQKFPPRGYLLSVSLTTSGDVEFVEFRNRRRPQ